MMRAGFCLKKSALRWWPMSGLTRSKAMSCGLGRSAEATVGEGGPRKRSGMRVIYYFYSERMPLFLLAA